VAQSSQALKLDKDCPRAEIRRRSDRSIRYWIR